MLLEATFGAFPEGIRWDLVSLLTMTLNGLAMPSYNRSCIILYNLNDFSTKISVSCLKGMLSARRNHRLCAQATLIVIF
jgi:hypothetical protein